MYKDIFKPKNLQRHFMSGISYMIPVIVMGGFLTAIARMLGTENIDGTIANVFLTTGSAGFALMIPVLTAGIAFSIAGKAAIAGGIVAGFLSNAVNAGFLGGLIGGLAVGVLVVWLNSFNVPRSVKPLMPILVIPVLSGILVGVLNMYIIGPPIAVLTKFVVDFFLNLNIQSRFLVGFILGSLTGFDMGGPVNKMAWSVVMAFAAEGVWGPAAGNNAAAMAPPLGIAISALILTPSKYTEEERENAKVAIAMGLAQVTEGALPFAFTDPFRVVPAVTIGSGIAYGLVLTWAIEVPLLHGGIFSVPAVNKPLLWLAALLIGATVTAVILSILKPKEPKVDFGRDEDIKDLDIDIQI